MIGIAFTFVAPWPTLRDRDVFRLKSRCTKALLLKVREMVLLRMLFQSLG
jgi:hypothetical protein